MKMKKNIKIIAIDLFAGGGGVTTGLSEAMIDGALGIETIIAINHDPKAIASHKANHPDTIHFVEDIRTVSMNKILAVVEKARVKYPDAELLLWASLECTNFSKAKGGQPREADSRTLAWDLYRYISALNPDHIYIENVIEFMAWGPLDEAGKPVSKRAGIDYIKWTEKVCSYGYSYDYRVLNTADYGAYTSRTRYFAQFVRNDNFFAWPVPTHARIAREDSFNKFKKWLPVREVLDFNDEGISIFGRKKQLSEKTLERIYAGLIKFVANGDDTFISKYYSGKPDQKNISIDGPAATIKTVDGQAVVKACFIQKYNSTGKDGGVEQSVVSVDKPSPAITTQVRMNVVQAFLMNYYGNGFNSDINQPAPTIRTKDGMAFVHWIDKQYGSGIHNIDSVEHPAGALTSVPKLNIVKAEQFLIDQSFGNTSFSLDRPAPTILACRKNHYLVNPQFNNGASSIDKPCFTLIARMDKRAPWMVTTEPGEAAILIYEDDSENTRKIKLFMAAYGIVDIKMRMLRVDELKVITGFPKNYYLAGNQSDQKKQIGNAVPTKMAQALGESRLIKMKERVRYKTA